MLSQAARKTPNFCVFSRSTRLNSFQAFPLSCDLTVTYDADLE